MKKRFIVYVLIFIKIIQVNSLELLPINIDDFEKQYHIIDVIKFDILNSSFDKDNINNIDKIRIFKVNNEKKENIYIAIYDNSDKDGLRFGIYCIIMRFSLNNELEFYRVSKSFEDYVVDMPPTIVFYEDENNIKEYDVSEKTLNKFKEYALKGGTIAPFYLFEYHTDKKNTEKAYYWLMIGAQNGNERCQYEYGKYLLASDDEYEKIRGGFWIRKAAKSGNADAKKLAETLGSETQ